MPSIDQILIPLLKKDPRFVDQNNKILIGKVIEKARATDTKLIELLVENKDVKALFFKKVKDVLVFDTATFVEYLQNISTHSDSIANTNDTKQITGRKNSNPQSDVVLTWANKDCILIGGMIGESGNDNGSELFLNEIRDKEKISLLLAPKMLTNGKRYYKGNNVGFDGKFSRDESGIITDNLIIKGENLLVLHSIKENFAGAVKLIYIDPPYNTGKGWFKYKDRFDHGAWLTFMKNRLEVSRELLRDDGVIFIQCDDNEQAYLKALMDEVFGRVNFVENFMWLHGKGKKDRHSRTLHEYAICFAKDKQRLERWTVVKKANYKFSNPDDDPRGPWFSGSISFTEARSNIHHDNYFTIESPSGIVWTRQWQCSKDEMNEYLRDKKIYFGKSPKCSNVPRIKIFPDDEDHIIPPNIFDNHGTTRSAKKELSNLGFDVNYFDTPKAEKLMSEIIQLSTKRGDIVLDFCLGSGTTVSVAHKLGRQYIGIEQMNYIETLAVERMKMVLAGERGGISEAVDWDGGGEFIYFEIIERLCFGDRDVDEKDCTVEDMVLSRGFYER